MFLDEDWNIIPGKNEAPSKRILDEIANFMDMAVSEPLQQS
jgi:hypothetical protein